MSGKDSSVWEASTVRVKDLPGRAAPLDRARAVLIHAGLPEPQAHALGLLLQDAEAAVRIPDEIARAVELTDYAVQTRYPGEYPPVTRTE